MRVGLVGCGAIARRAHLPGLKAAGAEVVAFSSRTRASAELAAAEAGSGVVVPDWRDLVALRDVDAVVISTPNALHAEQALAAIRQGKHVLLEKPFTVTVEEADQVLAEADRYGAVVMAAHNARFAPAVQAAAQAVRSGELGSVSAVRAVFTHGGPVTWAAEAQWFYDSALSGGGALLDLGVHLVDAVRFVLGDEIEQVSATLSHVTAGLEHDAQVVFDTRRGASGTLHAGWRSPTPEFSLTVVGERATLEAGADQVRVGDRVVELPTDVPTVQQVFVDAVAAGHALPPDGHDGRAAVAVVQACYASAREGRSIPV